MKISFFFSLFSFFLYHPRETCMNQPYGFHICIRLLNDFWVYLSLTTLIVTAFGLEPTNFWIPVPFYFHIEVERFEEFEYKFPLLLGRRGKFFFLPSSTENTVWFSNVNSNRISNERDREYFVLRGLWSGPNSPFYDHLLITLSLSRSLFPCAFECFWSLFFLNPFWFVLRDLVSHLHHYIATACCVCYLLPNGFSSVFSFLRVYFGFLFWFSWFEITFVLNASAKNCFSR